MARKEYALQGVDGYSHWSDAYPTRELARQAARNLAGEVRILLRMPRPAGHSIGAQWSTVEYVTAAPCAFGYSQD